ncbi:hypothetical protein HanXRQr2_Chr08g0318241 [Helianthus annuus]|uniref:Uncharacterized protein n=1 Tax=Helianthus annuus TaxID=4232 RepID=A0A251U230_HELAN|nr:hypothetical protein HanXRQr2_Chr08g0318241 [Helianthus annuus]
MFKKRAVTSCHVIPTMRKGISVINHQQIRVYQRLQIHTSIHTFIINLSPSPPPSTVRRSRRW